MEGGKINGEKRKERYKEEKEKREGGQRETELP